MLLPRILTPARVSSQSTRTCAIPRRRIVDVFCAPDSSTRAPTLSFVRHATHQAQGRANGAKDGPGKRLGAKKSGGEYVIPGNIIFRQRGTAWYPGENCKFGRDHCIFATESGYVRYYRDPLKHPRRQYIGVALDKNHNLPTPPNAARRRRLNMVAVTREPRTNALDGQALVGDLQVGDGTSSETSIRATPRDRTSTSVLKGKGYAYREANWEIGRIAEKSNVKVKKFVPGDRWAAWRKSSARKEATAERKRLRNAGKKTAKAKKR